MTYKITIEQDRKYQAYAWCEEHFGPSKFYHKDNVWRWVLPTNDITLAFFEFDRDEDFFLFSMAFD